MSRSGYSDDAEDVALWRGWVASAIRGKRGQAFLREMLTAIDALPKPELISDELEIDGAVCAIGAVGQARGIDMSNLDPEDPYRVAEAFGINEKLACEIVYMNDEGGFRETPYRRWERMRSWIIQQLETPI